MNRFYQGVRCLRCGHTGAEENCYTGCPQCMTDGEKANYTTWYDFGDEAQRQRLRDAFQSAVGRGPWKHRQFLSINEETTPISIGEGGTPMLHAKRLGAQMGLSQLYIKLEGQNPTWSYKDRMCSVSVTKAKEKGAQAVCIASSGNHGAAAAAYAAAAGIPCVVFSVPEIPETVKTQMLSYGAYLIIVPAPVDRWTIMRECVDRLGWFPLSGYSAPPVGSNPFGIDGYKSIAFEIFEALGRLPEYLSFPSCYGDGAYGTWKGIEDLFALGLVQTLPQMILAEIFGSLKESLKEGASYPLQVHGGSSICFSISVAQSTYQAYSTLQRSQGYTETCSDDETFSMQLQLARTEGIYAEASSLTSLVAIKKLTEQKRIAADEQVVAVLTSTGLKDPDVTASRLLTAPSIQPSMTELLHALKTCYGYVI